MEALIVSVLIRTLMAGTPLLLGTLGEIVTERSGILNLGVEGMMMIGAVTGFIVSFSTGNAFVGALAACVAGGVFSLIHAFISITLRANQVVSGLALTMAGTGIAGILGKPFIGKQLPDSAMADSIAVPGLSKIPFVGDILFNQDAFFYAAIFLTIIAWMALSHTRLGIVLRSVGENPKASEAQGVRVDLVRYAATFVGGCLAGLAGAQLSTSYSTSWIEGVTAGRGWIVIALTIFTLWNPLRAYVGAFLFGGIFVLQYLLQPLGISPNLLSMLPYLTTLLVLLIDGIRKDHRFLNAPAKLGEPYKRGER